jgi:hypothetical protein
MSQNKGIRMIKLNSNKEKVSKENKRIQVKIVDGRTIKGRFTIKDSNTIMIGNLRISISELKH